MKAIALGIHPFHATGGAWSTASTSWRIVSAVSSGGRPKIAELMLQKITTSRLFAWASSSTLRAHCRSLSIGFC